MNIRPVGAQMLHEGRHDQANSYFFAILRMRLKTREATRSWQNSALHPNLKCFGMNKGSRSVTKRGGFENDSSGMSAIMADRSVWYSDLTAHALHKVSFVNTVQWYLG